MSVTCKTTAEIARIMAIEGRRRRIWELQYLFEFLPSDSTDSEAVYLLLKRQERLAESVNSPE